MPFRDVTVRGEGPYHRREETSQVSMWDNHVNLRMVRTSVPLEAMGVAEVAKNEIFKREEGPEINPKSFQLLHIKEYRYACDLKWLHSI